MSRPATLVVIACCALFPSLVGGHPGATSLVRAYPGAKAPHSTSAALRLETHASSPLGIAAVALLSDACRTVDRERCVARARAVLGQRQLHPFTRASLVAWLAAEERQAGDREAAVRTVDQVHPLRAFQLLLPDGEAVTLMADPATGVIETADFLEWDPGIERTFTARLQVESPQRVWLLVTGAGLEQLCLGERCVDLEPMAEALPDQVGAAFELAPSPDGMPLSLAFSARGPAVAFRVRLADTAWKPIAHSLSPAGGEPLYRVAGSSRGAPDEPLEAGPFPALAPLDDSPTLSRLLAECILRQRTGRSPAEAGEALLARADELGVAEWRQFLLTLSGEAIHLEALRQARSRFPGDRLLRLAEARYRAEQAQHYQAYQLLSQECPPPAWACLDPETLAATVAIARTVFPALGLQRLLRRSLEAACTRLPDAVDIPLALAELLVEADRHSEAAARLQPLADRWPGEVRVVTTLAYVLDRIGRLDDEVALLERLRWLYPTRLLLLDSLASIHERAGRLDEAAALYSVLADRGRHQPYLLKKAAGFFLDAGERERALQLWEEVIRRRPQDRETKALVRHLRAEDQRHEEPLVTEAELDRLAESLPDWNGAFVGVLDRTAIRLFENGASLLRRTLVIAALDPPSASPFTWRFSYDSHLEEALLTRAEIRRADGTVVPASEHGDLSVSGEEYNLYYDVREVLVRFDDIEPGDLLVISYDIEADPSSLGAPFSGIAWLQEDFPKYNNRVTVTVPGGTELFHRIGPPSHTVPTTETLDEGDGERTWRFELGTIPAHRREPFPPGPFERSLYLHFSTTESWEEFARWYAGLIASRSPLDAPMRRLVESVAAEGEDPRTVAETLARYVADEVRYVGLELGVHGLQPYAPRDVFRRGFGDCKDKSLLLVTLLAQAGIEANVVVVATMPRGRVDLYPGSPSLFNHAIVYLPRWDLFFDPTARYLGLGILPWQDQGAEALIIDSHDPRRVTLPVAGHEETTADIEMAVTPDAAGGLQVAGTVRFTGQFAWRILAAMEQQGSWRNSVEGYLASAMPLVRVDSVEEEVVRGDTPAVALHVEGSWNASDDGQVHLLPEANAAFQLVQSDRRELPLVYGYPYRHRFRFHMASGCPRFPDGLFDARRNDDAGFSVSVEPAEDGGQEVNVEFDQRLRRVEPEHYADYRMLVLRYQEALARLQGRREGQ